MPQPKVYCILQYMICCLIIMLIVETEYIMQLNEMEKKYILDNEGNEYKPQKKFPKVWISQQVCPDLETKRKVSPDEDEK